MMKKIIYFIVILSLLFFLLVNPTQATAACAAGLMLWFESLVPTLLPFFILSNLLMELDGVTMVTRFFYPVFHRIFGCSREGCYAVMAGFLCGYPIGAKITGDLVRNKQISLDEGNYLLCFCNNVSPAFFIGYCLTERLALSALLLPSLLLVYGVPVFMALCLRRGRNFQSFTTEKQTPGFQISFKIVDVCMMNGLESILKLGCYIILFSMLARLLIQIPCPVPYLTYGSVGFLEITNGIQLVTAIPSIPVSHKYLFVLAFAAFGGISGAAQTESMILDSGLSTINYIKAKLATAVLVICLAFLFILLSR